MSSKSLPKVSVISLTWDNGCSRLAGFVILAAQYKLFIINKSNSPLVSAFCSFCCVAMHGALAALQLFKDR